MKVSSVAVAALLLSSTGLRSVQPGPCAVVPACRYRRAAGGIL